VKMPLEIIDRQGDLSYLAFTSQSVTGWSSTRQETAPDPTRYSLQLAIALSGTSVPERVLRRGS
jgi:hypothetical protein